MILKSSPTLRVINYTSRRCATGGKWGNCPALNIWWKKYKKEGHRRERGKEKKKRGKRKKKRKENTYDLILIAHPILTWGNKNCVTRSYVGGMGVNLGGQGDTI